MVSILGTNLELIGVSFAIILIIVLTVGGNLVVLFAFYTDPHLLTPSNHFLLSMAIADFLVGLIAMPFYSYGQMKNSWPFGDLFCKIWLTIDDVATMASVLSIVAITIERYWSINHSVHYRRYTTKTRIRIFSILIWLIPFLNFAPGIWILKSQDEKSKGTNLTHSNHSECIGAYHSHTIYLIIAQINFFAWPLVVIIILNALIVLNLYRRSNLFPTVPSSHELRKSHAQQTIRESKEKKLETENNMAMPMVQSPNNKVPTSEANQENRCGSIGKPLKDIDELIIANETVEGQPMTLSLTEENNLNLSSSSTIYRRFKHVLFSSKKSTGVKKLKRPKCQRLSFFAWRNSSVILSNSTPMTTLTNGTGETRNVRRLRRDKRAATSLLILVLVFMIFLLPYVVVVVAGRIFSLEILIDTDSQIYSAAFWLLWLNSTVNPILYPFIQPKFRDAYRKIFIRLFRRRPRLLSLMVDIQRDK